MEPSLETEALPESERDGKFEEEVHEQVELKVFATS